MSLNQNDVAPQEITPTAPAPDTAAPKTPIETARVAYTTYKDASCAREKTGTAELTAAMAFGDALILLWNAAPKRKRFAYIRDHIGVPRSTLNLCMKLARGREIIEADLSNGVTHSIRTARTRLQKPREGAKAVGKPAFDPRNPPAPVVTIRKALRRALSIEISVEERLVALNKATEIMRANSILPDDVLLVPDAPNKGTIPFTKKSARPARRRAA